MDFGFLKRKMSFNLKRFQYTGALALLAASYVSPSWGNEYDFSWLDPDKKIYVLQNRKYLKTRKLYLSLMGGLGLSGAYRNAVTLDPRIAYYFSEDIGFEAFFTPHFTSDNDTFQALKEATRTIPVIREIRSQMGLLLHWSPWYAKINVFNQILYFDWYLSGGIGRVQSELDTNTSRGAASQFVSQDFTGFFLGTGHQYHLSQVLSVRLDITGAFYSAPVFGTSGEDTWFSNFNFNVGIGLRP